MEPLANSSFFLTRRHHENPLGDTTTRTELGSSINNQRTVLESLQLAAAKEELHAIQQRRRGLNMQMEAEINRQLLLNRANELMRAKLLKERLLLNATNHRLLLGRELPFPSSSGASAYHNFIGRIPQAQAQAEECRLSMNNPSAIMRMIQNRGMLTGTNHHVIGQQEILPTLAAQQRQFSKVEDRVIAPRGLGASNSNTEDDKDYESSSESLPLMKLPGSTGGRTKKKFKKESKLPASASRTARILSKPRRPLSAYNFFFAEERHKLLSGMSSTGSSSDADDSSSCLDNRQAILEIRTNLLNRHSMWVPQAKRKHCKTHGKIGFQDLAKQISTKWRNLSPDQMKEYTALAGIAKKQYLADKDEYYRTKGRLTYADHPLTDEA
jgi:hypothetical protein